MFKQRPWFLIGVYLLVVIPQWLLSALANGTHGPFSITMHVVFWIANTFLSLGILAFFIHAHDDIKNASLRDLWQPEKFWYYLGASILLFLAVGGGFILLIVPGIIFGLMFSFATYLVIDRGLSPMEAMRESRRITYGHKWMLFGLGLLSILVALLGLICLIVGIFVAMPVTSLAFVHAYRVLQQQAGDAPTPTTA